MARLEIDEGLKKKLDNFSSFFTGKNRLKRFLLGALNAISCLSKGTLSTIRAVLPTAKNP